MTTKKKKKLSTSSTSSQQSVAPTGTFMDVVRKNTQQSVATPGVTAPSVSSSPRPVQQSSANFQDRQIQSMLPGRDVNLVASSNPKSQSQSAVDIAKDLYDKITPDMPTEFDENGNEIEIKSGLGIAEMMVPAGKIVKGVKAAPRAIQSVNKAMNALKRNGLLNVNLNKYFYAAPKVGETAVNPKTVSLAQSILSKVFSWQALAAGSAWASAVFLGKWAQAEAGEPLGFVLRDELIPNAIETGNWTLVEEAQQSRAEILDVNLWEQLMLISPLAPLEGIPEKIRGVAEAAKYQDAAVSYLKEKSLNGESEEEMWARIAKERDAKRLQDRADDKAYYQMVQERRDEAAAEKRAADEKYWADIYAKRDAAIAAKRAADEAYWAGVFRNVAEMNKSAPSSKSTYEPPSNLKFGLL
jgi:uncharacterized protein (UPF0212 family)